MSVLSFAFSSLVRLKYPLIKYWQEHSWEVQLTLWNDLIRRGEHTFFGTQYHFSDILSVEDFRKRVPIATYEDIKKYVDKIIKGKDNVLWDEPISWLAKSSGTTFDKSKFIPISQDSLDNNHFQASKDLLVNYGYVYPDTKLLEGKILVVGGSHQISPINSHIQYGDLSAVLIQNEPWLGRWMRVPELSIALLDEWEEKIQRLAESTMDENVTAFAGVPTWSLVLLKKILALKKARTIHEVWPNLELYVHGGVNFLPYRKNFEALLGQPIHYLDVYNASEGFFAFQDQLASSDLLLLFNHGIFYEFLPLERIDTPAQETVLLPEIELGKIYALVISTNGGLWRYMVGDTVMFTSLRPYRIKVVGRTQQFINAFGEEVIVDNTDKAVSKACMETGALLADYTVAPLYYTEENSKIAHEWLIEFETLPDDIARFITCLDTYLKESNSDYEAKRYKDIALQAPVVHIVPQGTFEKWLKEKGKLGGQHKIPRLANHRQYVEDIKKSLL